MHDGDYPYAAGEKLNIFWRTGMHLGKGFKGKNRGNLREFSLDYPITCPR